LQVQSFLFSSNDFALINPILKVIPFFEIGLGVLVFIFPFKKFTNICCALFHFSLAIFILFTRNNYIILIWNIYFLVFFLSHLLPAFNNFIFSRFFKFRLFVVLSFFFIFPFTNLIFNYNHYFSFSLYSGKIPQLFLVFYSNDNELLQKYFSDSYNDYFVSSKGALKVLSVDNDGFALSYYKYCLDQLGVPPVIENDVILKLDSLYKREFPEVEFIIYIN